MKNNNQPLKIWYIELELVLFKKSITSNSLIYFWVVYLAEQNFGLKHVTIVTDLRCFEKLGPGYMKYTTLVIAIAIKPSLGHNNSRLDNSFFFNYKVRLTFLLLWKRFKKTTQKFDEIPPNVYNICFAVCIIFWKENMYWINEWRKTWLHKRLKCTKLKRSSKNKQNAFWMIP